MEIIFNLISTVLIFVGVGYLYPKMVKYIKKAKIKNLPKEIIEDLKKRSFPEYYNFLYFFWTVTFLIIFLGGFVALALFGGGLFVSLQKFILARNVVYLSTIFPSVFLMVLLFSAPFFWGCFLCFSLWKPMPKNFRDYLRADSIKKWNWGPDEMSMIIWGSKVTGVLFLLFLPISLLGFSYYTVVFPDKVVHSAWYGMSKQEYFLDQINQLNVVTKCSIRHSRYGGSSYYCNGQILLFMKNGDILDLEPSNLVFSEDDAKNIKNLYSFLRSQGIVINIQKPSEEDLRFSCTEELQTLLELDKSKIFRSEEGGCVLLK